MPRNQSHKPTGITFTTGRTSSLPIMHIRQLQREGYAAFNNGQTVEACPHRFDPEQPDVKPDFERARAWIAGWCAAQTDARTHREGHPEGDPTGPPGI